MNQKQQTRADEVQRIRTHIPEMCWEIERLLSEQPERMNLGTWRALEKSVHRALIDIRDYTERDAARREMRDARQR